MAEIAGGASLTNEQRCKRSDGRGWRCRLPVAEGKGYCETHIQQALLRQKRQPVPDHLRLERTKHTQILPKLEQESDDGVTNVPIRRVKRKKGESSDDVFDVLRKKAKKENTAAGTSDQLESGRPIVLNLKMGRMEIAPADSSSASQHKAGSPAIKIGAHLPITVFRRPIRSKNSEPIPITIKKSLPGIKENINAAANNKITRKKKKIIKKCHWCHLTSFCVLVKCLTCKKHFFCEECINKRLYCKKTVERQCPVCQEECPCRACLRGKPKQVKAKELVIYDVDKDAIVCDPEKEMPVSNHEKMSDYEKLLQLHIIQELLPLMSKMNEEKIIELDTEAQNTGGCHDGLEVQIAGYTETKECRVCKACIPDTHRSCDYCSYVLCLLCCQDLRDGSLHSQLENLKKTKKIRSKNFENKSWRFNFNGGISCPPKNLGGCARGLLHLASFYPFSLTKDLEESAKRILCHFPLKKLNGLSNSSPCLLCEENGDTDLYFSTKQEFKDYNLEHFMMHWGKGKPIVIRDTFKTHPDLDLDWDFGFMLSEYLKKSVESRNCTVPGSAKGVHDRCEVEFGRKQRFSNGITQENMWNEFLKFRLRFSSNFLQDHFLDHHNAIIQSLPIQEYMNPFTGFMNLGTYSPYQTKNPNWGSYVSIFYGGLDNPMDMDRLSNLRVHAYDMVNVLVHASGRPMCERILNEVKTLMSKYNSQDHLNSLKKISNRNKLEGMFASTSRVDKETSLSLEDTIHHEVAAASAKSESESESESESDDDDLCQAVHRCGAHWDIFRIEDVPMLLEYLRKYSDKLISRSNGSPRKVVHPLFDEVFYLDNDHKTRLKEEFNVDALSFRQEIGEAVIIPAGCPYQMKQIKSCVHVVYKFMSPESALKSIKVSDEVRLLPAKHKAKGNMPQVKQMAITRMHAAIEAMREVFISQPELSWHVVISHSAKHPS